MLVCRGSCAHFRGPVFDRYVAPERCRPMLARTHKMLSSEQASWVKWKSNLNGDVGKEFGDNQSHSKDQKDQGEKKYSRG